MILPRGLCVLRSCMRPCVFILISFLSFLSIYLTYLKREGGGVVFQTVVSAEPGEHLISNPEWSAASRNKTSNLKTKRKERERERERIEKRCKAFISWWWVGVVDRGRKNKVEHKTWNFSSTGQTDNVVLWYSLHLTSSYFLLTFVSHFSPFVISSPSTERLPLTFPT